LVVLRKRVTGLSEVALARFVALACRAVRLRSAVNVLVTGSRELRALNRRFRGEDKPTDVLSFPPVLGLADGYAGDVAISADIAAQNARRLGHPAAEEIKILVLHGVLHLAGYNHEHDGGEMASREQRLRRLLRLPVGLIERNGEAEAKSLNRRGRGENRLRARREAAGLRSARTGQSSFPTQARAAR
jgi:probable rRNA maturation factor